MKGTKRRIRAMNKLPDGRIVCGVLYSAEEITTNLQHFLQTDLINYRLTRVMCSDIIAELQYWKQYAMELEKDR